MRKNYGQNFLVSPAARKRLLDALELPPGAAVWEPGPGLGAMTAGLLDGGARVAAFEIDPGFCVVLRGFFGAHPRFTLVEGDMMKTWRGAGQDGDYLLGNLPYNVGAALLADFTEKGKFFARMVVTVQKETGARMLARPGDRNRSSFSVLCQAAYRVSPVVALKGAAFWPEPRVVSQGLRLDRRADGIFFREGTPASFVPLVRALFAARRKTVKNSLLPFAAARPGMPSALAAGAALAALDAAGIDGRRRAEELDTEELLLLARSLEAALENAGGAP